MNNPSNGSEIFFRKISLIKSKSPSNLTRATMILHPRFYMSESLLESGMERDLSGPRSLCPKDTFEVQPGNFG